MKAKSFEHLPVWQDARRLVNMIYQLTSLNKFQRDHGLRDQIQRAAVSIMNNISEGFERDNNKEFVKFLGYAKGSAGEVRSMLYIAYDLNYITEDMFNSNYNKSIDIIKQISNFKKYLRKYLVSNDINRLKFILLYTI